MASSIHSVSTITPLRVSFFGGGSDFPKHYETHGGFVVSMAIQEFIYVTVKRHSPIFGEKYRVSYFETEHVDEIGQIKNDIVRACLELIGIKEPLFISTAADIPAQSGLGSSSSFAVGLLNALHTFSGRAVSAGQLAEEAVKVELGILGRPIGKQDQYAAAFGGLNSFEFRKDGRVNVDALNLDASGPLPIDNLYLVWTGVQRAAHTILKEQKENSNWNAAKLTQLASLARKFKRDLLQGEINDKNLSDALTESWLLKKSLASDITSGHLDEVFSQMVRAGALGGKLLGAGGGGFFMAYVPNQARDRFLREMFPRVVFPIRLEASGSRVVSITRR